MEASRRAEQENSRVHQMHGCASGSGGVLSLESVQESSVARSAGMSAAAVPD